MSYGVEIRNASDVLIISQDYSNYHVVSSGTISNYSTAMPSLEAGDLMYIRASVDGATIKWQTQYENGNYVDPVTRLTISAGVLEYVAVRRAPAPSAGGWGLRVYNPSGGIAFDYGRAPVKAVSCYVNGDIDASAYRYPWSHTISQPFSTPAGRKRYITGEPFFLPAQFGYDLSTFFWEYNSLTWNNSNSQTITGPGGPDIQGTLVILTVDI